MIIRSRAPLRLGLAGGGTDVSPYCDRFGGAILNVTIDKYAHTTIKKMDNQIVRFIATDLDLMDELNFDDLENEVGQLKLHKAVYLRMMKDFNASRFLPIEVSTYTDVPAGSGLGSSSTLVVSMIKAYVELLNLPLDDYEIASLAFQIERIDCALGGGRQDQYSAAFGGFNFMEFHENEKTIVNPLRVKNWIVCELESSLILFFTGISRESEKIVRDQSQNVFSGSYDALEAMHEIKKEALIMKNSLLKGDFDSLNECLRNGWASKKRSSSSVSNSHIDKIYDAAIKAGARSGKVSGAGGGGFMLFFAPPERRMNVIDALNTFDGQISTCHFTDHGCQSWKIL